MNTIYKKIKAVIAVSFLVAALVSCNKNLEQVTGVPESGQTVGDALSSNANFSIFYAALTRAGLQTALQDSASNFTIFAPDNNAMTISGFPLSTINALPITTLTSILQYHIIGSKVTSATFGGVFPNIRVPTTLALDPTNALVRMSIFPSKQTAIAYVNNTPITTADQVFNNGVIHTVATVVAPPSATLKTMIAGESTLSYFRAAIARADSGVVGLSKFDSLMNYGVTNMTVLAPNDAAFQGLLVPLITQALIGQGLPPATASATATSLASTSAVFTNPALYGSLNAATIQGIMAYHFFATLTTSTPAYQPNIRVFSNNVPATPIFIKTLVNNGLSIHPGIMAQATYTGPAVTSLKFSSYGTFPPGGTAFSYTANTVTMDKLAVNGVYHIIDKVLLPQ